MMTTRNPWTLTLLLLPLIACKADDPSETDSNGEVHFTSIFPGCYDGRWPHLHFEVRTPDGIQHCPQPLVASLYRAGVGLEPRSLATST